MGLRQDLDTDKKGISCMGTIENQTEHEVEAVFFYRSTMSTGVLLERPSQELRNGKNNERKLLMLKWIQGLAYRVGG